MTRDATGPEIPLGPPVVVMAGLVPAIHVIPPRAEYVDARHVAGHGANLSGDAKSYNRRKPADGYAASASVSSGVSTGPESRPFASGSRSTSSITPIAAASPWRKPALRTRV